MLSARYVGITGKFRSWWKLTLKNVPNDFVCVVEVVVRNFVRQELLNLVYQRKIFGDHRNPPPT